MNLIDLLVEFLVPNIWPLCFLLVAFTILRQLRDDVRPIFSGMVGALATQSQKNALAWAMAMMLGTVASLQAVVEVATQMHWVYVGAMAKVLQPGLAAIIAYVSKSPVGSNNTQPPFPTKP
jgi:hypothetical protein